MKKIFLVLSIMLIPCLTWAITVKGGLRAIQALNWAEPSGVIESVITSSGDHLLNGKIESMDILTSSGIVITDSFTDPLLDNTSQYTYTTITTSTLLGLLTFYTVGNNNFSQVISSMGARNIEARFTAPYMSTMSATANVVVYGIDGNGRWVNDTIATSTTIASGVKSFVWISSISVVTSTNTWARGLGTITTIDLAIGTGKLLGLTNDITNRNNAFAIDMDGVNVSTFTNITVNLPNDTIDFTNDPNNLRDYRIQYLIKRK